jgi:uncharacterized membrane protein
VSEAGATQPSRREARGWYRPTPAQIALGSALALLVFAYPFLFDWLLARFGLRVAAVALIGCAALFAVARSQMGIPFRWLTLPNLAVAATVALTLLLDDRRFLLLIPALIYLMIFQLFWNSTRGPTSIVEQVALSLVPHAPDFIGPYCRKSTLVWCAFFVANAALIAWLALSGRVAAWQAWTRWQMFVVIGALSLVDFLVRKWWFRYYYHNNWFDRLWSRIFPAENTAMGRRSMEFIRAKRKELGLPPQ